MKTSRRASARWFAPSHDVNGPSEPAPAQFVAAEESGTAQIRQQRRPSIRGSNLSRERDEPGLTQSGALLECRGEVIAVQIGQIRVHEHKTRLELSRDRQSGMRRAGALCFEPAEVLYESYNFIAPRAVAVHNQDTPGADCAITSNNCGPDVDLHGGSPSTWVTWHDYGWRSPPWRRMLDQEGDPDGRDPGRAK